MNQLKTFFFALVMTASTSVIAQPPPEYYRHLIFRESPYSSYQGIHPIDAKQAKNVAHYRFEYDKNERVTSVSHQIGDELIADNGNWDTFIWFSPKVAIEYKQGKETHRYFNVDNQPSEVFGKIYKAEYELNNNNQRISMSLYDQQGNASANAWGASRYNWSVDEEGRIAEKRFDLAGKPVSIRPGFDFYEVRLDYDKNGRLQFMYNYGLEGKLTNNQSGAAIDRIYYDLNGNFQRWQVYDENRAPVEGNIPMVHIGEHLYDSNGNKVSMRAFNRFGASIGFAWGFYQSFSKYDSFGNQIQTSEKLVTGETTNVINSGFSSNGLNRLKVKSVDSSGELVSSPMFGGAAAIEFIYPAKSKIVASQILYDTDMKVIKPSPKKN